MLTLDAVTFAQGDFTLMADVSFDDGVITAIIGPSGGGKSTLLSVIAGFVPVASGAVRFGAVDLTTALPAKRPVAVMFQDHNLFPHMTIAENVGLGLGPAPLRSSKDHDRVAAVLSDVGLGGFGSRKPSQLSGGQQSRAGLARILLSDRPVVLLDEPFAALGPGLRDEMLDLVVERLSNRTILMVSHDPKDALRVATKTCFLADGAVVAPRNTAELFNNPDLSLSQYLTAAH